MQKCDYCGIITKYKVDHCPYCGATSYTEIDAMDGKPYEITNISKIKFNNIPKPKNANGTQHIVVMILLGIVLCGLFAGTLFLVLGSLGGILTGQAELGEVLPLLLVSASMIISKILAVMVFVKTKKGEIVDMEQLPKFLLKLLWLPVVFAILGGGFDGFFDGMVMAIGLIIEMLATVYISYWFTNAYMNFKNSKRGIEKYNSLIKNGMLIKNVKYTLLPTSIPNLNKLKVEYTTSDGIALNLVSQKVYSGTPDDKDADILVDKNDFGNYFIDLEIS